MKGWRPISLLNVDYKIISTAIANRFKTVINRIISPSQVAYIKGRFIGENSRLVYDLISHANKTNQPGLIMAADFEAAFETISWPYIRAVLKEMNFGHYFISLVNIMYLNNNNFSRILLNGFLGEKIYVRKGIRQGDPVSGYLFNIAVEILAKQIAKSNKLNGIRLDSTEVRISQYADDTILFLDGSERSLNGVTEELNEFSEQSGLKLNWEKTSCLPLGSLNQTETPANRAGGRVNIKWVNEIKILGIYFQANNDNITELNLERKIPFLESEIAQWSRRHITPIGKITIIKSLIISKFVHLLIALPNPKQNYVRKLEGMLYGFLWNKKPDRIKRVKVIQSYEFDGLKMLDLNSFILSLKLSWIRRLTNSTAPWATLARMEQMDPFKLLTCGIAQLKLVKREIGNIFWSEVVNSLIHFNELINLRPENILTEPLWFSDHTKFRTSIVQPWDDRGLRFIGDLLDTNNGNFLSREEIMDQYRISMTFLCHETLMRSLPNDVRNSTHIVFERPSIPFRLQLFLSNSHISRYCYSLFVGALRKKCDAMNANLQYQ